MRLPVCFVKLTTWLVACALSLAGLFCYAGTAPRPPQIAAPSLAGVTINLQIEKTKSGLPEGFATQGAVARTYATNGQWTEVGAGGPDHLPASGSYTYQPTGPDTAEERSVNPTFGGVASTTRFHFETPQQGSWEMDWNQQQIVFSGRFSLVNTAAAQELAPTTIAGNHVALIIEQAISTKFPPGSFPQRGLVLQTYNKTGGVLLKGFGPGTVDSTGTYTYKKLSANTAVEEVAQVSQHFSYPYTMVYTFLTPTSGTWFQNFGNGLILFSGTFNLFPQ